MPERPTPSFEEWLLALRRLFSERTDCPEYVDEVGIDSWRDQYEAGDTPDDAFYDEVSEWADG